MKQYQIYVSPHGQREAIKQGWSWPAFFFGGIWALVKQMWGIGFGMLALALLEFAIRGAIAAEVGRGAAALFSDVVSLVWIAVPFVFGIYGNKWRTKNVKSRGFENQGMVTARNPEAAIDVWIEKEDASEATA